MFCPNCGSKLEDNAAFCPSCGAPVKAASANAATDNAAPNNAAADSSAQNTWQEAPIAPPPAPNSDPWQQQNAGEATVTNGTNPPDYLTINIVLTVVSVFVCCFSCLSIAALVTGIIGIVMSTAAKNMWIATAVILGVSVLLGLLLAVTGFMTGFMEEFYSGLY